MNEYNPYQTNPQEPVQPQQPQNVQPQQNVQPPQPPVNTYAPPVYQQPVRPQQPVYPRPARRVEPKKTGESVAAKVFSVISFCVGIFVLSIAVSLFIICLRDQTLKVFSESIPYTIFLAVPGVIFGLLAIFKKTKWFPIALFGIIFNAILIFESLVNFYVNLFSNTYYW